MESSDLNLVPLIFCLKGYYLKEGNISGTLNIFLNYFNFIYYKNDSISMQDLPIKQIFSRHSLKKIYSVKSDSVPR